MQAVVAEVAIEEGVVRDLGKRFRTRIFEAIVIPEGIAQEAPFVAQLAFEPGARIGLCAAEVERVLTVAPHKPQVDENLIQHRVRLEYEQVVRDMDVEIVKDSQRIQDVRDGLPAVEVSETIFRGAFTAQEHAEEPELVEDADRLLRNAVRPCLDGNRDLTHAVATKSVADGGEALCRLCRIGKEEVIVLKIEYADTMAMVKVTE